MDRKEEEAPQEQISFTGSLILLHLHVILKSILADSEKLHHRLQRMNKP